MSINATTGVISGTLAANASQSGPYSVDVTANDGQGGTVMDTFTWTVNNPAPTVGAPIADQIDNDGAAISLDVSGAFGDDDSLTFSATGLPAGLSVNATTGVIAGTLAANASQSGPYSVDVTADDGQGGTVTDTFTWTVNNPTPTASTDNYGTTENNVLNVAGPGVLANDSDPDGDPLTAGLVTGPTSGALVLNPDGSFTYTPNVGFTGSDGFTYQADDGNGGTSNATVNITVNPVNTEPLLPNAIFTLVSTSPTVTSVGTLTGSDPDTGNTLTYSLLAGNTGGAFAIDSASGQLTVANSAALGATPVFDLTVQVQDNGSPALTDTATVTVLVAGTPPPVEPPPGPIPPPPPPDPDPSPIDTGSGGDGETDEPPERDESPTQGTGSGTAQPNTPPRRHTAVRGRGASRCGRAATI